MTRFEMKEVANALEIPEELMMSLDKRSIFNSFNNNQDGEYFNAYLGNAPNKNPDILLKINNLENRIDFLEKLVLNLVGDKSTTT